MQIVTYSVRLIQSNGAVTHGANVEFIDSVPVKQVQKVMAEYHQRAAENVIVTELHRTTA